MRPLAAWGNLGVILLIALVKTCCARADVEDSIRSQSLLFETFNGDDWQERWKHASSPKYNGKFVRAAGKEWTDTGIKMADKSKFYGLTALLGAPVDPLVAAGPERLPLVVQYEVRYESGVNCGGSYIKLLSAEPGLTAEGLTDGTPYSIMFGPDRCGGPGKVHLILRHRTPVTGAVSEKHLASPPSPETNDYTHIYTLRLFPDNSYEILIDGVVKSAGGLEGATLSPPLLPPSEVLDPEDKKPADWVDEATMPDPHASKPDNWDEREQVEDDKAVMPKGWHEDEPDLIDDPAAQQPEDWDEEEDGVWEPNQIPNPKCKVGCGPWKRPMKANPNYKGIWKPPVVPNPDYKGPWVQRKIPNPEAFQDPEPLRHGVAPIGAVALELWTVDGGYLFDNLLISRDPAVAERALDELWRPRHEAEVKAFEAQLEANKAKEAEREAAAKEKKRQERRAARRGGRYDTQLLEDISAHILGLFEAGAPLAPLSPYAAPLLDLLRESPESSVLLLGVTPLLGLTLVMLLRLRGGSKATKKSAAAPADEAPEAKETDAATADGEEPAGEAAAAAKEEAEEEEAKEEPEEEKAEEAKAEEPAAEDEEEEEEEEPKPRRRTRRAA